jgi:tRNA G18 (ribose-2'-O)-methylase SpoU
MQDEGDESRYRDHVLATDELRRSKPNRAVFTSLPRNPVTVVLDGVTGNYNLGAIFRLCDSLMVERLIIAARRSRYASEVDPGGQARSVGCRGARGERRRGGRSRGEGSGTVDRGRRTQRESVSPSCKRPRFPAVLVLGSEFSGVSSDVLACADQAVAIPMLGMANSLNVATAGAIVLYELTRRCAVK